MTSRRERYERANMRGGLGVRKRLSEESMRPTYRLNGVRTGFAVARCHDKYGRWEGGYTVGVIVRKTSSIVQIRWLGEEDITTYDQGDARYEVDRGRWKILGPIQGNPLDPSNPLADALTKMRLEHRLAASANADTPADQTEEEDMAREMSNAAAERADAQRALRNGEFKDRETYTAKQIAGRCGTDAKTMRKFFRSNHSTVTPVGQGGRYEFDARHLPKIKREFDAWRKKAESRAPTPKLALPADESVYGHHEPEEFELEGDEADKKGMPSEEVWEPGPDYEEPTEKELAELASLENELDLDDLDEA